MQMDYDAETDSLYITLREHGVSYEAEEVSPGIVFDFDVAGKVVGMDIEHASEIFDLTTIETEGLPIPAKAPSGDRPARAASRRSSR